MNPCRFPFQVCGGLVLAVSLASCVSDPVYRPDQLIRIEHPSYVAELIKPETADFSNRNARFVEGAWLLSLISKRTGENVFYDRTVIPSHNARGLPVEFTDVIPLDDGNYLRPGVGIVSRESIKDRFHDRIRERFPWYSQVDTDATGTTVRFYQFAPHFYFYTRTVRFNNSSKRILFTDDFLNVSDKAIRSQLFFHPFFKVALDAKPWCRFDTKPDFRNPEHTALRGKGDSSFTVAKNPDKKPWFICGADDRPIVALWVENVNEVGIWREKNAQRQVFAAEPFVTLEAPPWQNVKWTWGVEIP